MKPLHCFYKPETCRYRRDKSEPCVWNNCLLYEKLEFDTREGEREYAEEKDRAMDSENSLVDADR